MTSLLRRLLRGAVLGMMLLLAGTANLVCITYDADNDEDTPPVSVELNIVTPCKRSIQLPKPHTNARTFHLRDEKPSTEVATLSPAPSRLAPQIKEGPPELLVPLRT